MQRIRAQGGKANRKLSCPACLRRVTQRDISTVCRYGQVESFQVTDQLSTIARAA